MIALPLPDAIIPLRIGKLSDFASSMVVGGKVRQSVIDICGKNRADQFALVVGLRYLKEKGYTAGSPPAATVCFYAEHQHNPSLQDVNNMFHQADAMFDKAQGNSFDLRASSIGPGFVSPDVHPGFGIDSDDTRGLAEIVPPHMGRFSRMSPMSTGNVGIFLGGTPGGGCYPLGILP